MIPLKILRIGPYSLIHNPLITSLKNSNEFGFVYRNGKSYANKYLVMYVMANDLDKNRIGISVSKKVGNSVVASFVKRMASKYSSQGKVTALDRTIFFQCFNCILRAGRKISACWPTL